MVLGTIFFPQLHLMSVHRRSAIEIRNVLLSSNVPMLRDGSAVSHAPDSLNVKACMHALSQSEDNKSSFRIRLIDILSQFL